MRPARARDLIPAPAYSAARWVAVARRFGGLRHTDALVVSYPKSGSTWLRFLLAHVLGGEEADYEQVRARIAPVGRHREAPGLLGSGGRILRTHEPLDPYRGVAGQPVVYLVRDPRAVCVSYFNHRRRQGLTLDFETFAGRFLQGRADGVGRWSRHALSARRFGESTSAPFLGLRYEDLAAEPAQGLGRVLDHLGIGAGGGAVEAALEANTRSRMQSKEDDTFLRRVGMDTPGLAPETRPFAELASSGLAERFERSCREAMDAWGYRW